MISAVRVAGSGTLPNLMVAWRPAGPTSNIGEASAQLIQTPSGVDVGVRVGVLVGVGVGVGEWVGVGVLVGGDVRLGVGVMVGVGVGVAVIGGGATFVAAASTSSLP